MGFSERKANQLYHITSTLSIIGLVFQFVIVFTYIRFENLRKKSYEMVLILSIYSIFSNAAYLIPTRETGSVICTTQGFFLNFGSMAMIIWATWIAYCLYCSVVLQKSTPSRKLMLCMTMGCCSVCSVVPLITGSYGNSGPWCWIQDGQFGAILRFVCFYLPVWICFPINVVLYFFVSRTLRRYAAMADIGDSSIESNLSNLSTAAITTSETDETPEAREHHDRLIRMATNLSWYPLILVVSWIVDTTARAIEVLKPSTKNSYTLAFIIVICDGTFIQSVGDVFAYGLNDPVKKEWRELYCRMSRERSIWPLFSFKSGDTDGIRGNDFEMRDDSATQ